VRTTALVLAASLSCGGTRDSVPESREVIVRGAAPAASGGPSGDGYDYVAKRPLAVVALAEARGIDPAAARAAVDRLADRLDACVTGEADGGALPHGAARVVAGVDADGKVTGVNLRADPGVGVATTAVLCLAAPARMLTFEPGAAEGRGFAIEALWGPLVR
jgi:hypothetical protein